MEMPLIIISIIREALLPMSKLIESTIRICIAIYTLRHREPIIKKVQKLLSSSNNYIFMWALCVKNQQVMKDNSTVKEWPARTSLIYNRSK